MRATYHNNCNPIWALARVDGYILILADPVRGTADGDAAASNPFLHFVSSFRPIHATSRYGRSCDYAIDGGKTGGNEAWGSQTESRKEQ